MSAVEEVRATKWLPEGGDAHEIIDVALRHAERLDALEAELARSGNYIANLEVGPTFIAFANKRTVKIVNGALEVGWLDDRDEEIAGPIAWKYAVGIKGSLALEQKAENERLRAELATAHNDALEKAAHRAEKYADDLPSGNVSQTAMRGAVRYAADAIRALKSKP